MAKLIEVILNLLFLFSCIVLGMDLNGKEIMESSFNRDDGKDGYFKIEMILVDKKQDERRRLLELYTKDYGELIEQSGSFSIMSTAHPEERSDEGSQGKEILPLHFVQSQNEGSEKHIENTPTPQLIKTFLKFLEPADIEGTAFLSWENETGDDTQYLYLPALGRARRIVSSQKNLRFVNTDFSYEDMQRRRPDKDEHKLLGEEKCNGRNCFVVESLPKDNSQYSKRVSWVDKESLVIVKIDFYNKKGQKNKIFNAEKLEKKSGIWTAIQTRMEDLQEKHKTLMRVLEVNYNQNLDDAIFSQRNLEGK